MSWCWRGYFLATAKGRREPKKLKLFRDWLADEVPASVEGYVHQNMGDATGLR
jgi:hypothetical protein